MIRSGVVISDHDKEPRDDKSDKSGDEEAHGRIFEGITGHQNVGDRIKDCGRNETRYDERFIERTHDVLCLSKTDEPCADDRSDYRNATDDERKKYRTVKSGKEQITEKHRRDRRDRVGLEKIRRHSGAIADVVADIVRDDRGISRIIFGDASFHFSDKVSADISRFGENTAAQTREDRDQTCAESEADECFDIMRPGQLIKERDREQGESDHHKSDDRAAAKRDRERRSESAPCCLGRTYICAHGNIHSDIACERGSDRADQKAYARRETEKIPEQCENDECDRSDDFVLLVEIRFRAFLYGSGDLLHPRISRALAQDA